MGKRVAQLEFFPMSKNPGLKLLGQAELNKSVQSFIELSRNRHYARIKDE